MSEPLSREDAAGMSVETVPLPPVGTSTLTPNDRFRLREELQRALDFVRSPIPWRAGDTRSEQEWCAEHGMREGDSPAAMGPCWAKEISRLAVNLHTRLKGWPAQRHCPDDESRMVWELFERLVRADEIEGEMELAVMQKLRPSPKTIGQERYRVYSILGDVLRATPAGFERFKAALWGVVEPLLSNPSAPMSCRATSSLAVRATEQPAPQRPDVSHPLSLGEFARRLAQLERDEQFKGPYGRRTDGQPCDPFEQAYDRTQWFISVAECRSEIEATPSYQEFRTACLRRYGEELSATLCRRLVADVLRSLPELTAQRVESFTLPEATALLESDAALRTQQPAALPPSHPGAEPMADPDAHYTVADVRELLSFRRESTARLQAVTDDPTLLMRRAFQVILPPLEQAQLAIQFRPLAAPRMAEDAATLSTVFPMLVDAARQESGSPLDEVALDVMVARVAIKSSQSPAEVWKLTLAAFRLLKWPDLDARGGTARSGTVKTGKRNRGRPALTSGAPKVVADDKLYRDWKASEVSQPEFLRGRGIPKKEGLRRLNSAGKRLNKPARK